jgi:hypothetical protein
MITPQQNLINNLKWRSENKERYNKYMNEYHKGFYRRNADKIKNQKLNYYYYKKEVKRLFQIYDAFL